LSVTLTALESFGELPRGQGKESADSPLADALAALRHCDGQGGFFCCLHPCECQADHLAPFAPFLLLAAEGLPITADGR